MTAWPTAPTPDAADAAWAAALAAAVRIGETLQRRIDAAVELVTGEVGGPVALELLAVLEGRKVER